MIRIDTFKLRMSIYLFYSEYELFVTIFIPWIIRRQEKLRTRLESHEQEWVLILDRIRLGPPS